MNLSKFLNTVDSLSESMKKEEFTVFVHDIARVLPENARDDFLDRMEKSKIDSGADSLHKHDDYQEVNQNYYQKIKEKVTKIEEWEICLSGDLNQEYDDWYSSDDEEFLFEDPEGIGKILEEACQFVHECVDKRWYKEGYELSETLIRLKIMVDGEYQDYSDEPLGIEELKRYQLSELNYKVLVTDTLYLTYCVNPLEKRADALYDTIQNSEERNISLEMIMQWGEELLEFDQFLPRWISYLGDKNSFMAKNLLNEAIELSNSSENLLSNARAYYKQHPGLYEKYMNDNIGKIDSKELLSVGKEALEKIDENYLVRSRIALLMAEVMLKEDNEVTRDVEQCWLEAFRSDTRVVHYLRMRMECKDFFPWKEEMVKIYHCRLKEREKEKSIFGLSTDLEKNNADINHLYLIALLNGEYAYVRDHGMNYKDALGWSHSYMKKGLAAFLMMLLNTEELLEGGKAMLSIMISSVGFNVEEYQQGTLTVVKELDIKWFWKCVYQSKLLYPMSEGEQESYLQWVEQLVEKRVTGIMEGNHRNYYQECAKYIAALGEVLESRGVLNGKQNLMLEYKQAYSRRSAFHKELRVYGMSDGHK